MRKIHTFYLFLALTLVLLYSCNKNNPNSRVPATTSPVVGLTVVSTLADTSIGVTGKIELTGGADITQHGHVYSETNKAPTLTDNKTEKGTSTGPFPANFTSTILGLKANTTYYVRAYASNTKGTGYGAMLEVKTEKREVSLPMLDAASVTDSIKASSFQIQSTITNNGNGMITQHGHVYSSKNTLPTLTDAKTELGIINGPFPAKFTSRVLNLEESKEYYVRPYVSNEKGTAYGTVVKVKTLTTTLPTLAGQTILGTLTYSSIKVTNTITGDGNLPITQYGHLISATNSAPTLQNTTNITKLGAYPGAFPKEFVGEFKNLTEKTTYYVRSYATNAKGTVYSTVVPIPTPDAWPTFAKPANLEDVPIYSLRLWFTTTDKANANTKDRVRIKFNDKMSDYYLDDPYTDEYERAKGRSGVYDIVDENIKTVADLKYLTLTKEGVDNWDISLIQVYVNGKNIFQNAEGETFAFDGLAPSLSFNYAQLRNNKQWKSASSYYPNAASDIHLPKRTVNSSDLDVMFTSWIGNAMRHIQDKTFEWWSSPTITYKNSTQFEVAFSLKNSKSTVNFKFLMAMPCISGTTYFRVLSPTPTNILDMNKLEKDVESRLNLMLDIPCKVSMSTDESIHYW